MVAVLGTEEFNGWFDSLPADAAKAVVHSVGLLRTFGVALGHPYSSAIKGSKVALRELRVKHAGMAIRVLYAFDPQRQAVLLVGGDKGANKRFYEDAIAKAEKLWAAYLKG